MSPCVLPGPIIPQPTIPMTMRSEGAGRLDCPNTLAGTIIGAATAAPVVARKRRREILELREEAFIWCELARVSDFTPEEIQAPFGGLRPVFYHLSFGLP